MSNGFSNHSGLKIDFFMLNARHVYYLLVDKSQNFIPFQGKKQSDGQTKDAQCAERILSKIAKTLNETFVGSKHMLQGLRIYSI